ncbi:MAG: hypothetical protein HY717_09630 [Planctomycetes bacterium]|nr:hypothetical protein [Planctomycetota bacterium]
MAIKSICPNCKSKFSAPEESLGKKIECPRCGAKTVLRTQEEIQQLEELQASRQAGLEEDWKRLALIEKMSRRRRRSARPYYETFGTGQSAVRYFNPNAPSRFLRLRALSELLLFFAYLQAFLVLGGMGITVYLKIEGAIESIAVMMLCLIGWAILGAALYLGFKFLGELAFLLSDVGDQQNDLVQLLLDIRENTDRPKEGE